MIQVHSKVPVRPSGAKPTDKAPPANPFQNILNAAMQNTKPAQTEKTEPERTKPAGKLPDKTGRPEQTTPDRTSKEETRSETDDKPVEQDSALAAAMAAGLPVAEPPQAETAQTDTPVAVLPAKVTLQTAPVGETVLEMPPLPVQAGQSAPSGDVLAAGWTLPDEAKQAQGALTPETATVSLTDAPAAQTQQTSNAQTETVPPQNGNDRFGEMLAGAQQELEGIAKPPQTTGQNPPATAETEAPPQAPAPEAEQPTESVAQPAENEVSPTAEEQNKTIVHRDATPPLTAQRPLKELPESDRAVMEMQSKQPVEPTEQKAEKAEPYAALELSRPVVTGRPDPVQEPQTKAAARTEQSEQVRLEMVRQLESGKMQFRMQLQPENLGKVDVRMALEDGRLAVEILAASPKAAEMLSRQAEGLIQSLRMQGFEVQSVQVVAEPQAASGQMNGAFHMLNGERQGGYQHSGANTHGGHAGNGSHTEQESPEPRAARAVKLETLLDYAV